MKEYNRDISIIEKILEFVNKKSLTERNHGVTMIGGKIYIII